MSDSVVLGAFWVLAASITALLPIRKQFAPGVVLMLLAPVLVWFLGWQHGWIAATGGAVAFLSTFRKPIRYYWRKWRGQSDPKPEER